MSLYKETKDQFIKFVLGRNAVPAGLVELSQYFRSNEPIEFRLEKQEDGSLVAISKNFRFGSIITHVDRQEELDAKIRDAILTAFEVPSSYAKEAGVGRVGEKEYAFA